MNHWRYTESFAVQTKHFANVMFVKNLRATMTFWRNYDIQNFTADIILFREIHDIPVF